MASHPEVAGTHHTHICARIVEVARTTGEEESANIRGHWTDGRERQTSEARGEERRSEVELARDCIARLRRMELSRWKSENPHVSIAHFRPVSQSIDKPSWRLGSVRLKPPLILFLDYFWPAQLGQA